MHSCRCGHEASSWVDVLVKEQVSKAERAAEVFHQVQDDAAALKDLEVFKSELKKNGVTDDEYNAATKSIKNEWELLPFNRHHACRDRNSVRLVVFLLVIFITSI